MTEEYKEIFTKATTREEFVGTLLLNDWEMPRATALSLWAKFSKPKKAKKKVTKKKAAKKEEFSFSAYEPEKPYTVEEPHFPDTEKKQPGVMKWMEFKDMTRFVKDRNKLTRAYLNKFGFTAQEVNWLVDNGYVKYGGYEL